MGCVWIRGCRFRDAVGAGGMVGRGHHDAGSEAFGCFLNAFVVSGDDDGGELLTCAGTLVDVLQQWFAAEMEKRLPWEAARGPTGWNDSYDLRGFGGGVQATIMGFETLGKF